MNQTNLNLDRPITFLEYVIYYVNPVIIVLLLIVLACVFRIKNTQTVRVIIAINILFLALIRVVANYVDVISVMELILVVVFPILSVLMLLKQYFKPLTK